MQNEIEKIKRKYNKKIEKYTKSLNFLKKNSFLKNINEYNEYKDFANKMKQKLPLDNESFKDSTYISDTICARNNVVVYDYQQNNISIKNFAKDIRNNYDD